MGVQIVGRKIPASVYEVFVKSDDGAVYAFPHRIEPLKIKDSLDPESFALIQEGNQADQAISMFQGFNGKKQLDTIVDVLQAGLSVPTYFTFMHHYRNVNWALREKSVLYDADGNLIEGNRLKAYADALNNHCNLWLNGRFVEGSGFNGLDLEVITGLDVKGDPIFSRTPLEKMVSKLGFVKLDSLNGQGLPVEQDELQKFEPGRNFFFNPPKAGKTLMFAGYTGGPQMFGHSPMQPYTTLGIFSCVKGE